MAAVVGVAGVIVAGLTTSARAADLPAEVRTGDAAAGKNAAATIDKYVQGLTKALLPDPNATRPTKDIRDELCRQVDPPPSGAGVTPSASFKSAYVDAVVNNLDALMGKDKDAATRLNAAVIIQRLTVATSAPQLETPIARLLADDSPAVALWGVKAAGALLPSILVVPFNAQKETLTPGIVAAVKKHSTAGAVVQDAYAALDVSVVKGLNKAVVEKCLNATMAIMRMRINMWVAGVPVDPHAEGAPVRSLANQKVIDAVPAAKQAIAQHLMDLLAVTVKRSGLSPASERQAINAVTVSAAQGMTVLMLIENSKPASDAAVTFEPWTKASVNPTPAQAESALKNAFGAVKSLPTYSTLNDPPAVTPATAN